MKRVVFVVACIAGFLLALGVPVRTASAPLEFNEQRSHQLRIQHVGPGELEFTTEGDDPWIELKRFDADKVPVGHVVLAFEYFSPEGVDGLSVYYGPPISGEQRIDAGSLGRAESWLPAAVDLAALSGGKWTHASNLLRLDFGRRSGVTLRVRNLHLRAPSAEELRSAAERDSERRDKLAREARVNAFYAATFPDRVESVTVDRDSMVVRGRLAENFENAALIEVRPEVSVADRAVLENGPFILHPQSGVVRGGSLSAVGAFEIRLARVAGAVDRTTSRWAVASPVPGGGWKLRSHWKHATDLSAAAAHVLPPLVPKGVKGMGGVGSELPLGELVELGVHNVTVNIAITGLMDAVPHPGWTPFEHGGRKWFVNPSSFKGHDQIIEFCSRHGIVASGILLVPFSKSEFGRMLVHPEADRAGHYAMPNFTTADGVAAYEAVMELLARRYASGSEHGRIANWIIHNEVGYGWEWTNMGRQPQMLYMDHYLRSMRLVHDVVRRHDPHARVFISLTHHWNTPHDDSWKSYCNRDLLDRLLASSRVEGDFAWGVAYHPYPQNLRRPDAWNDTQVTDDFDTRLITPKNIAVLDRWMHRPESRDASGRVRGVLLSEQGFNTPDYSETNQRLQAAGFVYMWRQMRGLASIEAFHNHRWVDHPREGGLLLGVRKLPSDGRPYGDKKFSWEVYKALDTPAEKRATAFADEVVGRAEKH